MHLSIRLYNIPKLSDLRNNKRATHKNLTTDERWKAIADVISTLRERKWGPRINKIGGYMRRENIPSSAVIVVSKWAKRSINSDTHLLLLELWPIFRPNLSLSLSPSLACWLSCSAQLRQRKEAVRDWEWVSFYTRFRLYGLYCLNLSCSYFI